MPAYNARAENYNPHIPPPLPTFRWSLKRRLRMSLQRCEGKARTPGRARRSRREHISDAEVSFLARVATGEGLQVNPDGFAYSIYEVLHQEIRRCPRWFTVLRATARGMLAQAQRHGPASGWALEQPRPVGEVSKHWTRYYVPKAGEKCWRWWRWLVLGLMRLLTRMAQALPLLVPALRLLLEATPLEASGVESRRVRFTEVSGCRDKRAQREAEEGARVRAEMLARPFPGSEEAPIGR